MATMPTQIKELNELLNEKKWNDAQEVSDKIKHDMERLGLWLGMKKL